MRTKSHIFRRLIHLAALLGATIAQADTLRIASFNTSFSGREAGELRRFILSESPRVRAVAEIIQRVRPDIILLHEFDYDPAALVAFQQALQKGQDTTAVGSAEPITFPHSFTAPVNTGEPSGFDLNGDGVIGGAGDAYGFGYFPGQYGMAVLSRYPIIESRSFQRFLWADMPGNLIPKGYYTPAAQRALRLSSKSHWHLTIQIGPDQLHLLASHPTPPVFDGVEDRNGRRNFDEIRFWADYVTGAGYFYDDSGNFGGLHPKRHFVIAGDLNADPLDGESRNTAIAQLLEHPLINADITPASQGGALAADRQKGANLSHKGNPAFDTADFGYDKDNPDTDRAPGNLRVDYVLPSRTLWVKDAGVYWLTPENSLFALAEWPTSDHRLVWIDIETPLN
ncbi:MAG: endonuclease/exonuclease/phosphatase family protein [Cognatishimia sp.]|uniref:endonuclease/exonuclease/phosphatase family protein n=1 Tax=Cognatishimia sp. TaxID=2211648 RepID=UPI004059C739